MQPTPIVYLQDHQKYDHLFLKQFFDDCFRVSGKFSWSSSKVIIKPNLITARSSGPACTDPRFILALSEWFIDNGAKVAVGDSPAFGRARGVLSSLLIEDELERRDVQIVDFETATKIQLECGINVGVAAEALDYDYFINAPKLKAHNQMYVTLAVKNIFGIVLGMRKSLIHMLHGGSDTLFSAIILDLLKLLPSNFSVIDGIEVMHKEGPINGEKLNLGCVGFSRDPIALDTSLLAALQLDPVKSQLWCEAKTRKYPGASLENIEFPFNAPDSFHGVIFEAPEELSPIRFNPLRFLFGLLKRLLNRLTV